MHLKARLSKFLLVQKHFIQVPSMEPLQLHYITTSHRFKCVIRKWATPLDTLASGLGFIPWGIDFGSRRIPANKC